MMFSWQRSWGLWPQQKLIRLTTAVALMGGGQKTAGNPTAREPGKPCPKVGGFAPHLLAGIPGLPGPPRFEKYKISDLFWPSHYATPECRHMKNLSCLDGPGSPGNHSGNPRYEATKQSPLARGPPAPPYECGDRVEATGRKRGSCLLRRRFWTLQFKGAVFT